jgi:hypothetical protein
MKDGTKSMERPDALAYSVDSVLSVSGYRWFAKMSISNGRHVGQAHKARL